MTPTNISMHGHEIMKMTENKAVRDNFSDPGQLLGRLQDTRKMMLSSSCYSCTTQTRLACNKKMLRLKHRVLVLSSRLLSTEPNLQTLNRNNQKDQDSSYLYVIQTRTPFTVEPDLDFRQLFNHNFERLKFNLKNRSPNLTRYFLDDEHFLKDLISKYNQILAPNFRRRYEIKEIFNRNLVLDDLEKEKLKIEYKNLMQILKENRRTMLDCLKLPNFFDEKTTPLGSKNEILQENLINEQKCNHLEFLNRRKMIKIDSNPQRIYLKNEIVEFLEILQNFLRKSFHSFGCRMVTLPHFVRSFAIECLGGHDFDHSDTHKLAPNRENNRQAEIDQSKEPIDPDFAPPHLTGNSIYSYLSLFVEKRFSHRTNFPLKFHSVGTSYKLGDLAENFDPEISPLKTCLQRPILSFYVLSRDQEEMTNSRQEFSRKIAEIFGAKYLNLNFKLENVASRNLRFAEFSRWNFRDPKNSDLLAFLTNYDDFLCRRLKISYSLESKSEKSAPLYSMYGELDLYNVICSFIDQNFSSEDDLDLNMVKNRLKF